MDMGSIETALRWVFDRLVSQKEQFRPIATNGFATHGRGAMIVQIQFDHLMTRKGDQLQVAYIPQKMVEEFQNDLLNEYVSRYDAVGKEFVLTVVSRKDTQTFVSSNIMQ